MGNARTLLTYHDLAVEVESTPGEELLEHMHSTVLGQPGTLRYQHTDLRDRLNSQGENYYMYLRKNGKMLGSVGFCGKPSSTLGKSYDTWMIRYFSIKAPIRGVPKKRKEKGELKEESKRSTVLGRFIQPVFADPSQLREGGGEKESPSIVYAIIEQKNLRSMNFSAQMGLETVREVIGFSFSRLHPRRSPRVEQLRRGEQQEMLALLERFYSGYNLYFPDSLFKDDQYYVIRDQGRIVAGVQVYPVTWRIIDFGSGLANWLVGNLQWIRYVTKRVNPEAFRLLAFDGIYCEKGYEEELYELMEGVFHLTGNYVSMLLMDKDSSLFRIFRKRGNWGPVNRVVGTYTADVRVRFIHLPDEVRRHFQEHPTYIPTYDNS